MRVTPSEIIIEAKDVHPSKVYQPMFVTLEGIKKEVKLLQLENALLPILATRSDNVIEDKLVQP